MNEYVSKMDRLIELEQLAIHRYLDKSDYNMYDWLSKSEIKEYKELDKWFWLSKPL